MGEKGWENGKVKGEGGYLEFDVKEGWEPLCRFLGKDVPTKKWEKGEGDGEEVEEEGFRE